MTTLNTPPRTIHLPTGDVPTLPAPSTTARKGLRLTDLREGDTARVVRLAFAEPGCRKRFAELGLAEGMKVTVLGGGETMMLLVGGCRMGIGSRCAADIVVARIK